MPTPAKPLESSVRDKATKSERMHYIMKRNTEKTGRDALRREYDLSKLKGGVRGKYYDRYKAGTNLVLLSPDVAEHFPDERSVNAALRTLIGRSKS